MSLKLYAKEYVPDGIGVCLLVGSVQKYLRAYGQGGWPFWEAF